MDLGPSLHSPPPEGLLAALEGCRQRGVTFNHVQARLLELLWRAGKPLTAYAPTAKRTSLEP